MPKTKHPLITRLAIITLAISPIANAEPPSSFSKAKRIATNTIYKEYQTTFYCGCDYQTIEKKNRVDLASCGYQPRKNEKRASRVEWEHIVPAWHFGHQRQCWQNGGRKNCTKNDPIFKMMEADLHNLVPAIGEANGDRSNYKFGIIQGETRKYGNCDFEVDFKAKTTEPTDTIRGDIARTYFYMRDQYHLKISPQQTKLLNAWSKLDPVDEWECEKNKRVGQIQTTQNAHITQACNSE